jgi:hypothetical protein
MTDWWLTYPSEKIVSWGYDIPNCFWKANPNSMVPVTTNQSRYKGPNIVVPDRQPSTLPGRLQFCHQLNVSWLETNTLFDKLTYPLVNVYITMENHHV